MEHLLIAIIAAPLLAAVVAPLFVRTRIPAPGWWLAAAPMISLICCIGAAMELLQSGVPLSKEWTWVPSFGIQFSLYFDGLSLCFAALISAIGVLIVVYAGAYFSGSAQLGRFYCQLFGFMGAMLGIVVAGDLLTLFVFWELTSITSYLLIGFSHREDGARANALQALLVTGGGGLALLAGIVLTGHIAGGYGFAELFVAAPEIVAHPAATACLVLILLGAFTKSAQFPFHFWLPNAMAAPAPVSAYLHSSTMVKAGVYLLARLAPVWGDHAWWSTALLAAGGSTALVSTALALRQTKMKPLLAYTTMSALGTLVAFIGLGTPGAMKAMLVFLFVHALYKAALFMIAGTLERRTGEKDVEQLHGLGRILPTTAAAAALAALAMAGLPPFLGFIGKELLYEHALAELGGGPVHPGFMAFLVLLVLANGANVFVALMIGWRPFWGGNPPASDVIRQGSPGLWSGAFVLGLLGLGLGVYTKPLSNYLVYPGLQSLDITGAPPVLTLWHGLNPALALSGVTLTVGGLMFLTRQPIRRVLWWTSRWDRFGSAAAYDRLLKGFLAFARWQTGVLQNGYLPRYLLVTACAMIGLVGSMLVLYAGLPALRYDTPVDIYGVVLTMSIAIGAISVVGAQSRLAAVAFLGIVGFAISLVYVLYSAPDLAMTQFVIETITVVLFILVLRRLPRFQVFSSRWVRLRDGIVAAGAGILMTLMVLTAVEVELAAPISSYYIEQSVPLAHGRNIVNTILVDFRALDTLGEIAVLSVAALGAYGLLRLRKPKAHQP